MWRQTTLDESEDIVMKPLWQLSFVTSMAAGYSSIPIFALVIIIACNVLYTRYGEDTTWEYLCKQDRCMPIRGYLLTRISAHLFHPRLIEWLVELQSHGSASHLIDYILVTLHVMTLVRAPPPKHTCDAVLGGPVLSHYAKPLK